MIVCVNKCSVTHFNYCGNKPYFNTCVKTCGVTNFNYSDNIS